MRHRVTRALVAIGLAVTATLAVSVTTATPAVSGYAGSRADSAGYAGTGRHLSNRMQGMCLTYPWASFNARAGGALVLDWCRGQVNQKWIVRGDGLIQSENGDCVELDNIGGWSGVVVASLCNPGNPWETWSFGSNQWGNSLVTHNIHGGTLCASSSDGGGPGTRLVYTWCGSQYREQGFAYDRANAWRYVSLGDSYSAGNGAGSYVDWVCYNSWNNYASRLNASLAARGKPQWGWVKGPSCSGSTTGNYWGSLNKGNGYVRPPQRGYLDHDFGGNANAYGPAYNPAENGLVSLTFGGNDVGFAPFLYDCLAGTSDCATPQRTQQIMNAIAAVRPALVSVYRDIAAYAPNARIRVLNYPLPIGRDGAAWTCLPQFSDAEYALELQAHQAMNQAVADAVNTVRNEVGDRLRLVDVAWRFAHHGVCGNADDWINPVTPGDVDGSFHPNVIGYGVMADALADSL